MTMHVDSVPNVGAFLLGAPKSGTTWLASALEQHPEICVSNPKEPNEIATHKGTFGRMVDEPNWERYATCFDGVGLRLDCSVHTLACPIAPTRIAEHWPEARFVVCLREPRSRTISHWGMVLDTEEDKENGVDWVDFTSAWRDERLRCDTLYGASMGRWLEVFSSDRFLLIDSRRMREDPGAILVEVQQHLGVRTHDFDLSSVHNANVAGDRRPLTLFGRGFRFIASLVPGFIKRPLVDYLQGRGKNVYKMPVLSKSRPARAAPTEEQSAEMDAEVTSDIAELGRLTGFNIGIWLDGNQ